MKHLSLLPLVVLGPQACGQSAEPEENTEADQTTGTEPAVSVYSAALAVVTRLEGDADRDAARRPDGAIGIVDHPAGAGAPRDTGGTLHRIAPVALIENMDAAGFVLDGESDLLSNDSDEHLLPMFDPQVRGSTDRFVLRFRKAD